VASSSETLPSLASIFTGISPDRHGTLEEGIDRLPRNIPTLASVLEAGGFRTAGFPSLGSLGLSSGLSRGFRTYGWSAADLVGAQTMAESGASGWSDAAPRREGLGTVADALGWVRRHRSERLFLWIHL